MATKRSWLLIAITASIALALGWLLSEKTFSFLHAGKSQMVCPGIAKQGSLSIKGEFSINNYSLKKLRLDPTNSKKFEDDTAKILAHYALTQLNMQQDTLASFAKPSIQVQVSKIKQAKSKNAFSKFLPAPLKGTYADFNINKDHSDEEKSAATVYSYQVNVEAILCQTKSVFSWKLKLPEDPWVFYWNYQNSEGPNPLRLNPCSRKEFQYYPIVDEFWFFWRPNSPNCASDDTSLVDAEVQFRETPSTNKPALKLDTFLGNNNPEVSFVFSLDDLDPKSQKVYFNEKTQKTLHEILSAKNFEHAKAILSDSLNITDKSFARVLILLWSAKQITRSATIIDSEFTSSYFKIRAQFVTRLEKKVSVNFLIGTPRLDNKHNESFYKEFLLLSKNSSVSYYYGHSGLGHYFSDSFIERLFSTDKRQILFFFSCHSFYYWNPLIFKNKNKTIALTGNEFEDTEAKIPTMLLTDIFSVLDGGSAAPFELWNKYSKTNNFLFLNTSNEDF